MSDQTRQLDEFFSNHDFINTNLLSNCCGAPAAGEIFRGFGRCGDCYEMAEFKEAQDNE